MREAARTTGLIIAAVLFPVLLFIAFQTAFAARDQRRDIEARALAKSEAIVAQSDAMLARTIGAVEALSTIRALPQGDIPSAYERAKQIAALNPDWITVTLTQVGDGTEWFDLRRSLGAGLLAHRGVTAPRGTSVGPVLREGPGCPCVVVRRAAPGPTAGGYVLTVLLSTRPFERLLPPPRQSDYEVSAIVTGDGRFVARSLRQAERVGTFGSSYLVHAAAGAPMSGVYRGTTLEGFENYTAFSRSRLTGWSAHLALDAAMLDTRSRLFRNSLGIAALLSLMLAVLLLLFVLRQAAVARTASERGQQAQKLEALGQLTGGIAHDFNNLLTPIVGALDALSKKAALDERSRRLAAGALAAAERAGKLTGQLLAFSRRQKLKIVPVDLSAILDDIRPMLEQSIGKAHRLEIVGHSGCVRSDVNQLELAILNLVLNARDASPPNGGIRIEVEERREAKPPLVMLRVIDQGKGMDAATKARAFEPFFTTKLTGKGTGLGLAQVFGVAQQSGGELRVSSTPGAGTVVTMILPYCDEPVAPLPGATPIDARDAPPRRLLVVDDDHLVRDAIVHALQEDGHMIDSVSNGAAALAAIGAEAFDLVVVDFAMPNMDGAELIREARKIRPDSRFLMVTGYADSEAVAAACPDTPIVRKPFDPGELRALVASLAS